MHSVSGKASGFRRKRNGSERPKVRKATIITHGVTSLMPRSQLWQNVGHTTPVDSYPEGVSGFGIYNMAGNVFEWVEDWSEPKPIRRALP